MEKTFTFVVNGQPRTVTTDPEMAIARSAGEDLQLTGYEAMGLRGLLRAHPEDVYEVEVGTPRILEDLDTPQDFNVSPMASDSVDARSALHARDPHIHGTST